MGGTVVSGPPQTQTGGGLASLLGAGHHQAPAMATVVNQAVAANKAATPATQAQKLSSPEAMTEVGSESRAEEPNKNWGSSVLSYKGA